MRCNRFAVSEKNETAGMNKVLKVLNTVVSGGRDVKCESCGNDFTCGVSLKGCWCSEVKLDDDARARLRSQYKDCLCKDCLESLATARENRPT